ncbi:MAG: mechanosensitive ion channel, partial [Gemmatimonadales bacterium]|nr:mechanosensitive ion channel [Gemmatimonadales bacterium]
IDQAREVLLEAAKRDPNVSRDPAPVVVLTELGGSSVNLEVRVWIDDAGHERPVFVSVLEAGKKALDRAGIEIPYPHLQL